MFLLILDFSYISLYKKPLQGILPSRISPYTVLGGQLPICVLNSGLLSACAQFVFLEAGTK
jgi:hypothetical protein